MRSNVSKNNTPGTSSGISLNANNMTTDLTSYEDACKLDPELQSFDATLRTYAREVIQIIAAGVEGGPLSFSSLWPVTKCLVDMNQHVVTVIMDCEIDIWNEKELSELVDEYFENSRETLMLYNALKKCLQSARNSQLPILQALQHFDEDTEKVGNSRYARTLQGLKNFREADDPFTKEFFKKYKSVCDKQKDMLSKWRLRKDKLDKKLKNTHTWRKVSSAIFAVTVATLSISSIVAAVAACPQVAAIFNVSAIAAAPTAKWIDSLLKTHENAQKEQMKETDSVHKNTYVAIRELENIKVLIDGLTDQIESLRQNVDFAIEQEAVKDTIEEIKKQVGHFMKDVEDLRVEADICSSNVMAARKEVLQRIKMRPHN